MYTFLDENKEETNDIHSIEKNSDEFIDLIFIFKHKRKYTIEIYANDINKKKYNPIVDYNIISEEE